MRSALINIFWPAAAGNVFWAGFTVAIKVWRAPSFDGVMGLAALALLAFYLTIWWTEAKVDLDFFENHGEADPPVMRQAYVYADVAHLLAILAFAIGVAGETPLSSEVLCWILAIFFAITFFGHQEGWWKVEGREDQGASGEQLARINAVGIVIIMAVWLFSMIRADSDRDFLPLAYPLSIGVVLPLWLATERRYIWARFWKT